MELNLGELIIIRNTIQFCIKYCKFASEHFEGKKKPDKYEEDKITLQRLLVKVNKLIESKEKKEN